MKQITDFAKIMLIALSIFSLLGCVCPWMEKSNLAGEQLIKDWIEMWNAKDLEKVDLIFTDDCIYEDVPSLEMYSGKEEVKASLKEDFSSSPDLKVEMTSTIITDDWVVIEWVWSGTQTGDIEDLIEATGKSYSVRGTSIMEIQDGKIKRISDYYDAGGLLYQLGVRLVFPSGKILEKTE